MKVRRFVTVLCDLVVSVVLGVFFLYLFAIGLIGVIMPVILELYAYISGAEKTIVHYGLTETGVAYPFQAEIANHITFVCFIASIWVTFNLRKKIVGYLKLYDKQSSKQA